MKRGSALLRRRPGVLWGPWSPEHRLWVTKAGRWEMLLHHRLFALYEAMALHRFVDEPPAAPGGGVKVERPQRSEDERP